MKIVAYIWCMFVASANSGHTFDGSTFKGIDVDGDFGRGGWHGVSQDVSDGKIMTFSVDHKVPVDFDDYGAVFGNGKPITEVMQEDGTGSQGDYGKYALFKEDVVSIESGGSAAISSTGWHGISGGNSDFREHNQAGMAVHEAVGTGGLGSFRTLQPIGHNEYVRHEGLADFNEQHKFKTIKSNGGEDGSDTFGAHGDLSEFTAGQSYFGSYDSDDGYKNHFAFDQFGEDQEEKGFHDEDNNEDADIFKTHIGQEGAINLNQFGGFEEFFGQQEHKTSEGIHADDYSHDYHEYDGFNTADDGFEHKVHLDVA